MAAIDICLIYELFSNNDLYIFSSNQKHKSSVQKKKPNGDPRKLVSCEKCSRHYWSRHDSRDRKQRSIQTKDTYLNVRAGIRAIDSKAFFNILYNMVGNIAVSASSSYFLSLCLRHAKIREIEKQCSFHIGIPQNRYTSIFLLKRN